MHCFPSSTDHATLRQEILVNLLDDDLDLHDDVHSGTSEDQLNSPLKINSDGLCQEVDINPAGYKAKVICPFKYEAPSLDDIMNKSTYLISLQLKDIGCLLGQYPTLFNGILKKYMGALVHLELFNQMPNHLVLIHTWSLKHNFK